MRIEIYDSINLPDDLIIFWKTKCQETGCWRGLTGTPEWYGVMKQKLEGRVFSWRGDDGKYLCVLPTVRNRFEVMPGLSVNVLKVVGGEMLGERMDELAMSVLWDNILDAEKKVDAIWFDHFQLCLIDTVKKSSSNSRKSFAHLNNDDIPHYRLRLTDSVSTRSARTLRKIYGRQRALERRMASPLVIREIRSFREALDFQAQIEHLMSRRRWQALRRGGTFSVVNLKEICDRGWLRSFLMTTGETPVAFVLGYQGNGIFVYEDVGYEPTVASFSPGTILLYRLMEILKKEDPPVWIDFGEGEAEYKAALATDVIRVASLMIVRRTAPLLSLFLVNRIAGVTRRLARRSFLSLPFGTESLARLRRFMRHRNFRLLM